jgi:hypothetical protein
VPAYTLRRLRRGAVKTVTIDLLEQVLVGLGRPDLLHTDYKKHVEEAHAARRENVMKEEELRPILRVLTSHALLGVGNYTADELAAVADWRWMHAADWSTEEIPLFTGSIERHEVIRERFIKTHGREPHELPQRIRDRGIAALTSRQQEERGVLQKAEQALGRTSDDQPRALDKASLNEGRVYELTRGARDNGYLSRRTRPRGYGVG